MSLIDRLLPTRPAGDLDWLQLSFGRQLDHSQAYHLVGSLLASNHLRRIVFEVECGGNRDDGGDQLTYRIGSTDGPAVMALAAQAPIDLTLQRVSRERPDVRTALRVTAQPWDRMLVTNQPEVTTARLLGALALAATTIGNGNEQLIHQIVVGRRVAPRAPSKQVNEIQGSSALERAIRAVTTGPTPLPAERLKARAQKQSVVGAQVTWRILSSRRTDHWKGRSTTRPGTSSRALRAYSAVVRSLESPGLRLRLRREHPGRAIEARPAWNANTMTLNAAELTAITAWPFGSHSYAGLDRRGATKLPVPSTGGVKSGRGDDRVPARRVIATSDHPATVEQPIVVPPEAGLHHLHVLGPTGVGKSTLLLNLILSDIAAGRGVVVLDPKGDLVDDVLASAPPSELERIVVLDPARTDHLVGFNPLRSTTGARVGGDRAGRSTNHDLAVDGLLHIFTQLYGSNFGPRSSDIVHSALLSLAASDYPTLCLLPQLLIDARLRRVLLRGNPAVESNAALKMFWAWYEGMSEGERSAAIAPVQNKLRPVVMRNSLRGMLGQTEPKFDLRQVSTERKVLLVPLRKGQIGPQASQLLGSMIVANLWQHALGRTAIAKERRHPVFVYLDEFQDYLHLPTDMGDVLAQARALGLGLVLAHQHLGQLEPRMRSAMLANARNKVVFGLSAPDAKVFAAEASGLNRLDPVDFQELSQFQIYALTIPVTRATSDGQHQPWQQGTNCWTSGQTMPPPTVHRSTKRLAAQLAKRYGRRPVDIDVELLRPITDRPIEKEKGRNQGHDQIVGRRSRTSRQSPPSPETNSTRTPSEPPTNQAKEDR